jgi:hypothetical protein
MAFLKDVGIYKIPKTYGASQRTVSQIAGQIAKNTSTAVRAGARAGYYSGRANYVPFSGNKAQVAAIEASFRAVNALHVVSNMNVAYRLLAGATQMGTYFVTHSIPAGGAFLKTNIVKYGKNVWRFSRRMIQSALMYVWKLIQKLPSASLKAVRTANKGVNSFNTKLAKNIVGNNKSKYAPKRKFLRTPEKIEKITNKRMAGAVKRTARILKVSEVGLASYGIKSAYNNSQQRKADAYVDQMD